MPTNRRSSIKTFRCSDTTLRDPTYQPIVVVEKLSNCSKGSSVQLHEDIQSDNLGDCEIKLEASDLVYRGLEENQLIGENLSMSSFELHLSPDSLEVSGGDNSGSFQIEVKEELCSENIGLSLNCPDHQNRQPDNIFSEQQPSQDIMFNNSPNQIHTQDMFQEDTNLKNLHDQRVSVEENREKTEEWDSQELTNVSQRLRIRRKQVKRMFMEVIRKRQMADESLGAFKKRLKKL